MYGSCNKTCNDVPATEFWKHTDNSKNPQIILKNTDNSENVKEN